MDVFSITHGAMEKSRTLPLETVRDLIALWPSRRVLGLSIGVDKARIDKWAQTESIPARYHRRIIEAAQNAGHLFVTADVLVEMHDRLAPPPLADTTPTAD